MNWKQGNKHFGSFLFVLHHLVEIALFLLRKILNQPRLDDMALLDNGDTCGELNRRRRMTNQHSGSAFDQGFESFLN